MSSQDTVNQLMVLAFQVVVFIGKSLLEGLIFLSFKCVKYSRKYLPVFLHAISKMLRGVSSYIRTGSLQLFGFVAKIFEKKTVEILPENQMLPETQKPDFDPRFTYVYSHATKKFEKVRIAPGYHKFYNQPKIKEIQFVVHKPLFGIPEMVVKYLSVLFGFFKTSGLENQKVRPSHFNFFRSLSLFFRVGIITSIAFAFFLIAPDVYLRYAPYTPEPVEAAVNNSVLAGNFSDGTLYSTIQIPAKDLNLPTGNWLIIPKTGVRTSILESVEPEESLKKGVWRVTDFANPVDGKEYPTILAAHKYGYLKWNNQYRRQNSFYNLEKLEIGDTFDIIWDQRRFSYEIYAGEEGKEISDYEADVILYTCKYLNSPVRYFRYARKVEY